MDVYKTKRDIYINFLYISRDQPLHTVDISGIEMCRLLHTNQYHFFISEQTNILVHLQTSDEADLKQTECFAIIYICLIFLIFWITQVQKFKPGILYVDLN